MDFITISCVVWHIKSAHKHKYYYYNLHIFLTIFVLWHTKSAHKHKYYYYNLHNYSPVIHSNLHYPFSLYISWFLIVNNPLTVPMYVTCKDIVYICYIFNRNLSFVILFIFPFIFSILYISNFTCTTLST
jgi:hypothetical protein